MPTYCRIADTASVTGRKGGGDGRGAAAGIGQDRRMLALLSGRFRRLLFFMIAVPIGGRALEAFGRRLESRTGPTRVSRALRAGGRTAGRFSWGPLRPR